MKFGCLKLYFPGLSSGIASPYRRGIKLAGRFWLRAFEALEE
jgi:hypothetical protein